MCIFRIFPNIVSQAFAVKFLARKSHNPIKRSDIRKSEILDLQNISFIAYFSDNTVLFDSNTNTTLLFIGNDCLKRKVLELELVGGGWNMNLQKSCCAGILN